NVCLVSGGVFSNKVEIIPPGLLQRISINEGTVFFDIDDLPIQSQEGVRFRCPFHLDVRKKGVHVIDFQNGGGLIQRIGLPDRCGWSVNNELEWITPGAMVKISINASDAP